MVSTPQGSPKVVEPNPAPNTLDFCQCMLSAAMERCLEANDLVDCVQENYDSATTGLISVHEYLEEEVPAGEFGRLCTIGCVEGRRGKVRFVGKLWEGDTSESMWSLPGSALEDSTHVSHDRFLVDSQPTPLVRYEGERADLCPAASHPNNAAHPSVLRPRYGDGQWVQDPVGGGHHFVLDFTKCTVGSYCVSLHGHGSRVRY